MISVIIPSYNQAQYLPDAIESAIAADAKEIIVIDDGSTDGSLDVAKKYGELDARVKVVSQRNKGLAAARNTGIMNATGDYVLPLDADDMLEDNAITAFEDLIHKTNADVIAASFKCFGVENSVVTLQPNPTLEDFKTGNRLGYCAAIRRSALLEIGGYSTRMTWGWEDYHLWFDLLSRGKQLVTTAQVLWLYRTKQNSMIHSANEHAEELWAQIKKDFPTLYA